MDDVPCVLIVGEGPVSGALAPMVAALGWRVVSADSLAAVTAALPDAHAVVVLSHDDGLDGPALAAALAARAPYVGAMGSRRTQARRRAWLTEQGFDEKSLRALHAPIGLDIGADEPGEIAVSILAEIIAVRRHAPEIIGQISDRAGAIHPRAEPGTATCPGG